MTNVQIYQSCGKRHPRNKLAVPSRRSNFIDTLTSAREIMKLSETAYRIVRPILSLPSEQLLCLKFLNLKLGIQEALADPSGFDELIAIWQEVNGIDDTIEPTLPFLQWMPWHFVQR
jgi:hypothetical protein